MQLFTCCPHEGCGAFQETLSWLKSWGIEPSLEHDGEHHYFEFEFPGDWGREKRIKFRWKLCERTSGMVFCRCGLWLDEDYEGEVHSAECRACGRKYLFCMECSPIDEWDGCDCRSRTDTHAEPSDSWTMEKDGKSMDLTLNDICGLFQQLISADQLIVFDTKSSSVMNSSDELGVSLNGLSIQITVAGD